MLVQDTIRTILMMILKNRKGITEYQIAKTYIRLVLQGKLHKAVLFVTERNKGTLLYSEDVDAKSGNQLLEIMASKHPEVVTSSVETL